MLTTSGLPAGNGQPITATYSGDGDFSGGTGSLMVGQTVTTDGTTTTVSSLGNSSADGQLVTFTATVASAGPGTIDNGGTVQFMVDNKDYGLPVPLRPARPASATRRRRPVHI